MNARNARRPERNIYRQLIWLTKTNAPKQVQPTSTTTETNKHTYQTSQCFCGAAAFVYRISREILGLNERMISTFENPRIRTHDYHIIIFLGTDRDGNNERVTRLL